MDRQLPKSSSLRKPRGSAPTAKIRQIHAAIRAIDWICPGTLLRRWKLCGRPNCRCAHDPQARHGPYFEWSRREDGRLRHSLLSPAQAQQMTTAIHNHAEVLRLLARWSQETAHVLRQSEAPPKAKSAHRKGD
jgi:hypothetical protein